MRPAHASISPLAITGTLVSVQGATIIARLPQGSVGDLCWIRTRDNREVRGQIVSFQENNFALALFDEPDGIFPGAHVRTCGSQLSIPVSTSLLGHVISPLGIPLFESPGPMSCTEMRPIHAAPPLQLHGQSSLSHYIPGYAQSMAFVAWEGDNESVSVHRQELANQHSWG